MPKPDSRSSRPDPPPTGPPPALATRILRARLPDELVDAVTGDLAEDHSARSAAGSKLRADIHYWREVLLLRAGAIGRQARRLRHAQSTRYGRDAPGRRPTRVLSTTATETMFQDLKHAFRRLFAHKTFAATALISLALGIGANTTVFGLINSIFFRGSGVTEPDRVVQIFYQQRTSPYWAMSELHYRAIREELGGLLESVSIFQPASGQVEGAAGSGAVFISLVGPDFFESLGRPPLIGRAFNEEEHTVDEAFPVAVLGHGFWTRTFGADPGIVGTEIVMNARRYTVVGVSHPDYRGPAGLLADVFVPLGMAPHIKDDSEQALVWTGIGRMRDGVSEQQVQAALDAVGARITAELPEGAWPTAFSSILDTDVGLHPGLDRNIRPMAALSLTAALLVLLVACTNLAAFLLAQGTDRRKEFAIRSALGAGRRRVVSQLVSEALLLGLLGGAAGIAVAYGLVEMLGSLSPPVGTPFRLEIGMDHRVLGFAFLVMLAASAMFGLLPALQSSKPDVAPTLRDDSTGSGESRGSGRIRRALVVAQVALSMTILVGAGLFVRSLLVQLDTDPGFRTDGISIVSVDADGSGYTEPDERRVLYDAILRRTRAIPGVEGAALASRLPLQVVNWSTTFSVAGVDSPAGRDGFSIEVTHVSPEFFDLMEIPIVSGRGFTASDGRDAPNAIVVNEAVAAALWPGRDPVGAVVHPGGDTEREWTVIGVAAQSKVKTLGEGDGYWFFYRSIEQAPAGTAKVLTRGAMPSAELAGRTARAVKEVDADLFVPTIQTMRDHVGVLLYLPRLGTLLLGAFGLLALVLAAIGLYGIVSYAVARRRREVGIRMSLGARSEEVVRMMMGGGLKLVVAGASIGLLAALAGGRLLQGFLFGVQPWDPLTLVVVPLVLGSVGALATWLPARRASSVDPVQALRSD